MKIDVQTEQELIHGYISHLADLAESFFPDDLADSLPHLNGGLLPVVEGGVTDEQVIAAKMILDSASGSSMVGNHLPELLHNDAEAYEVISKEVNLRYAAILAAKADPSPRVKMSV